MNEATQALAHIDAVLAHRPRKDDHALSQATMCLTALRDRMARAARDGGRSPDAAARGRLEHVNAIISVVMAIHFPLGDIPWHELELARNWLLELAGPAGAG